MILLSTDFYGLVIRPRARVAMVREEFGGRLEVLADDGTLSHRPGPLSAVAGPPFVEVAAGTLVHPRHASREGSVLVLPGGWRVEGRLPDELPPEEPEEDPVLPGGVRASEVLYVDGGGHHRDAFWVTDHGPVRKPSGIDDGRRLARLHPDLRPVNRTWFVNPRRLSALRRITGTGQTTAALWFDQGLALELSRPAARAIASNLGAAHYDCVGGETGLDDELRALGLRRWPFSLRAAGSGFLAREYPREPTRLLVDLAVQTVEAHARGEHVPGDHRTWLYTVARPALQAAGHLESKRDWASEDLSEMPIVDCAAWRQRQGRRHRLAERRAFIEKFPLDRLSAWILVCTVWAWLVGELRLFTYRDAGFGDPKPEARRIGDRHQDVVLLVEKKSLVEIAFAIHERHGVTVMVLGGLPTVIGSERLSEDLLARGVREVRLISFCDFDPPGWDIPTMQADHLARYGLSTRGIRRMVTPARFTEDELRRFSVPLDTSDDPSHIGRLRRFMKETGGVLGQARGISADFLLPLERAVGVFEEAAGDWL